MPINLATKEGIEARICELKKSFEENIALVSTDHINEDLPFFISCFYKGDDLAEELSEQIEDIKISVQITYKD